MIIWRAESIRETEGTEPVKVLTIAGSDSGGAAGLQADLKTFTALGAYGMSVVTVVTAQNSARVAGVHPLPSELVIDQLEAVLDDYGAAAIKSGFLGRRELVTALAAHLQDHPVARSAFLIVDPVLVNHRAQPMFGDEVTAAYAEHLLPLCDLVTPNCAEAALLTGQAVNNIADMRRAARQLYDRGAGHVLVTGGQDDAEVVDLLYDGQEATELRSRRIGTENTHGAGDTFSAAIAVFLARGESMTAAVQNARHFTAQAIAGAAHWRLGSGHGPLNHLLFRKT